MNRILSLVSLSLLTTAGCGPNEPARVPVFPASGTISFGSKSLDGAMVALHPLPDSPDAVPARGTVDSQGHFRLTTYDANDGAAEGSYAVTVAHYPAQDVGGSVQPGPNVLPPKYASPATTDLKATIAPTADNSLKLELKPK